ncbi:hypothetical protein TSAR_015461 [Trichomalopsis sarcophagae]|uniref:Uncharacterized protein n=1 Tax=Trichomalopsis sarcophagae TaxID=543379 RepID=A0A232EHF2_9HYME|nr:hypothetical protein TSAR_015461 [Trichomalopsis sarcophagae]
MRLTCQEQQYWCITLTTRIEYTSHEIQKVNPTEKQFPTTIQKRSALHGFIGSLSKSLFGTLLEADGEYLTDQINQLFKGQLKLAKIAKEDAHIVKHKISSIESQFNETRKILNETIQEYRMNARKLNDLDDI